MDTHPCGNNGMTGAPSSSATMRADVNQTEPEEVPDDYRNGFDQHREQITWHGLDSSTGELRPDPAGRPRELSPFPASVRGRADRGRARGDDGLGRRWSLPLRARRGTPERRVGSCSSTRGELSILRAAPAQKRKPAPRSASFCDHAEAGARPAGATDHRLSYVAEPARTSLGTAASVVRAGAAGVPVDAPLRGVSSGGFYG